MRLVDKKFRVHVRCLEVQCVNGQKAGRAWRNELSVFDCVLPYLRQTALQKCEQMTAALERFVPDPEQRKSVQKMVKARYVGLIEAASSM